MQPLNPLTIPLKGQILIEASAGTGKTYTIALLFLRLLLEKKISVDQILIVTFTKAATEELRGRVRLRIKEALDCLQGDSRGNNDKDETLTALIGNINEDERETAAILLTDALLRMDEAAIFTIHGFCQRMLQEHAFESASPFVMEFLENEAILRSQIIEDFWRNRFYGVSREEARWVMNLWETPDKLLAELTGHVFRHGVRYIPKVTESEIKKGENILESLFKKVRVLWEETGTEIIGLLYENKKLSRDKRKGYAITRLDDGVDALNRLFAGENIGWLLGEKEKEKNLLRLFTISKINESLKKTGKGEVPAHSFFDAFDELLSAHAKLSTKRRIMVFLDAMEFLRLELKRRKRENGQLYFDDLLTELSAALAGECGLRLAMRISKKYPAILIDEFQDTDQLQYRIFANIHKGGNGNGLFLIGDPKQAVYGFRGADIFTYIKARQDTGAKRQFTMTTNYRSSGKMVESVNRLFSRPNPFVFAEIDFSPVKAGGMADKTPFTIGDEPVAPLHWLILEEEQNKRVTAKRLSKDKGERAGADLCAEKISSLLAMGKRGEALFGERPLNGGDIAVLVRTHREAETVRRSLDKLGITSVYISQKSVFKVAEASQLFMVLSGLYSFTDQALVCNLLTTELFACTAIDIDRLRNDETKWAELICRLDNYLQIWKRQGVLSAFYRLLGDWNGVERILGMEGGERKLTNYQHLVESLQEVSTRLREPERLLRWFEEEIENKNNSTASDSQQLRLESDQNLVKLVTIHKAKGLEYSVVFLPFLWSARACKKDDHLIFHGQEQSQQLLVDLGSGLDCNYELAEKERLAEDLRLLYVALTRARYSCFICWGWINKMEESALNYLLHGGVAPCGAAAVMDELRLSGGELLVPAGERRDDGGMTSIKDEASTGLLPALFNGHIDNSLSLFSYSSLTKGSGSGVEQPDYDRVDGSVAVRDNFDIDGFPRGAAAGICIHAILEHIDFTDSANHANIVEKQLQLAGYDEKLVPFTCNWIRDILTAELIDGFSLSRLDGRDRIDEMSFFFSLEKVNMSEFNRILGKFSIAALNPGENFSPTMHGLMTGFIDLVYRYKNRFFIVDYKSNYLGTGQVDYNQQNLSFAVSEHRYDIQYLIYTLALHRYLGTRLPDYDYKQHLGGVQYLFLRGMGPWQPVGTAVFSDYPPSALIRELDGCFSGEKGEKHDR
jgi:exodeoxyribonuclease V beta subunit